MKKKRKQKKKKNSKPDFPILPYIKSIILGILFIGALGKTAFYPQVTFFFLGFFISLFLSELVASGPISIGISLLGGLLITKEGSSTPAIVAFFAFLSFVFTLALLELRIF